ncbi:MAG: AAA family ATPase [Sandaracinaceae bacterium]
MGSLRDDLARDAERVWETHISWVFARGGEVFKVKKPVALGFLDFSTLPRRREACEAEVALNARLARGVYRGVEPITRDPDGTHRLGGAGTPVEWAVRMRRLADEDRADVRLEQGLLGLDDVDRVAEHLAAFHDRCRADDATAAFGRPEVIRGNVTENFEQTRGVVDALLRPEQARAIEAWQLAFLEEREELFLERVAAGRVRDGHGDLRLEHVYLEVGGEVQIIDGIEFNERFRFADVCADIAFLSMDLAWHGRVDLAERLLSVYAREANDFDLYPLVDFYESYRAYVRGKVRTMLAADAGAPAEARARARREARRYFLLALAADRRPLLPPTLVAVGGWIAAGKSTLADRLSAAMGAPSIATDRIRKHLLGAEPTERRFDDAFEGAYDPGVTDRVYAEVARLARVVLDSGRPVILDASFRTQAQRAVARRVAEDAGVPFHFVECRADPEVCRARLRERHRRESVSDGRLEIFDAFLASWEPVEDLGSGQHHVVRTDGPVDAVVEPLRAVLPLWPPALTG